MGIKTIKFGPVAWLTIEGVARQVDAQLRRLKGNPKKRHRLLRIAAAFFVTLGFITPCGYCRVSVRHFTRPEHIDVVYILKTEGAKKLVYVLRQHVNHKLMHQEMERNPDKVQQIEKKWARYEPTFQEALSKRFAPVTKPAYWVAFQEFAGYIMCDYRPNCSEHVVDFFRTWAQLLSAAPVTKQEHTLAAAVTAGVHELEEQWSQVRDRLDHRIDVVFYLVKGVQTSQGWKVNTTPADLQALCEAGRATKCA